MKFWIGASLALLVLGLMAPEAAGKTVWGSRKKERKQRKTSFEQLNEDYQELDLSANDESTDALTALLELSMNGEVDALGLLIQITDTFEEQFNSKETISFFKTLNIKEMLDAIVESTGEGDDWLNSDLVSQLHSVSGADLHSQGKSFVAQVSATLKHVQSVRKSKRKLEKALSDVPPDARPIFEMILELDASSLRSILAGAVSSLKPMEQLMLNKLLSGDISGCLSLLKQHLKQDGEIERMRQWLLPYKFQFPDPFRNILEDRTGFESYVFEMFDVASDIGKNSNKLKEL